jgi:hypothetical protein
MISATAWNNGAHHHSGAGYGLSVSAVDRDQFFRRSWGTARLQIDNGQPFAVNIDKPSFWDGSCLHLINVEIGRWLIANSLAPWPRRQPPRVDVIPRADRLFEIRTPARSA